MEAVRPRGVRLPRRLWSTALCGLLVAAPLGCGDKEPGGGEEQEPGAAPSVTIASPQGPSYVRDLLTLQVRVQSNDVDSVELLKDGEPLTTLAPPYQYLWDTTSLPEAEYVLTARVTRRGQTGTSGPLRVTVDRTPPTLVAQTPVAGQSLEWDGAIRFTASEPLAPGSVTDLTVRLMTGPEDVPTTRVHSTDGRTVELLLRHPLSLPSELAMVLTGVTDRAGNPLVNPVERWAWEAPAWRQLGASLNLPGTRTSAHLTSMTSSLGHLPVVAFEEVSGQPATGRTIVARWTGGSWERIGPPDVSGQSRVVQDQYQNVHLATFSETGLTVRRHENNVWRNLGEPFRWTGPQKVDAHVQLTVTPRGAPVVAYHLEEPSSSTPVAHVAARLDQGPWRELASFPNTRVQAVLADETGPTWLLTTPASGGQVGTLARRWNGTSYEVVGGVLETPALSDVAADAADLALSPGGEVFVALRAQSALRVLRWSGSEWNLVGWLIPAGSGVASAEQVSLAVNRAGRPLVASVHRADPPEQSEVRVHRYNGDDWELIFSAPADSAATPELDVDFMGRPLVAWQAPATDGSTGPVMRVRSSF